MSSAILTWCWRSTSRSRSAWLPVIHPKSVRERDAKEVLQNFRRWLAERQSADAKTEKGAEPSRFPLWLFATSEGVSSARRLADSCDPHRGSLPYLWLVGGVSLNYHTLADFRVDHADLLDQLMTDGLAVMLHEGLLEIDETAQDSLRVRASAGSSSFRRRPSLEACQEQACQYLEQLQHQSTQDNDPAQSPKKRQAQQRAASERHERIGQAFTELEQLQQQREKRGRAEEKDRGSVAEARASTTDKEPLQT